MAKRCFGCMQMKENDPICEHCGYDERTKNSDHQLPVGTILGGQYTVGKALGQGGFGITYLAWDQVMNQPVAVKEYFPKGYATRTVGNLRVTSYDGQNAHDFEFNKKRFLREAESLAKLWNIPQIVKILRYFEENGTAYIVMEYIRGTNLRNYVKAKGHPLVMEEILRLLEPVVYALSRVHEINLVHRDIAPDNIMILPDGSAKLLDFGAARYVENANAEKERPSSTQQILKHGFAPPEQYRSHGALGPWTDVYALCATVYYCISGRIPTEAMARTIDAEPIDWGGIPNLDPMQKATLEKGMALQAKERYATVRELWEQLKPPAPKPDPEPMPQPKPEPPKKHCKKLILCVIATLAVVVALYFFAGVNNHREDIEPLVSVQDTQPRETQPQETDPPAVIREPNIICRFQGNAIIGYEGDLPEDVVLPSEHEGKLVSSIGEDAFLGCSSLRSVIIPNGITSISWHAFLGCSNLRSVTIPDSVTDIFPSAFSECSSLTSVIIPDSITTIAGYTFSGCSSLTSVIIPDSVTSIESYAFSNCSSLASVTIPGSVTSIYSSAFSHCSSLTSVIIPDSVTTIGDYAFSGCSSLTSVSVSKDCEIGSKAFPDTCIVIRR